VWASCLQLLSQQLAGLIATVEAIREINVLEVGAARHGSCKVGFAGLARHVWELDEADALAEVLVATNTPTQLLESFSGSVYLITVAGLAAALVGVDLLKLTVVDSIDADAVVPASGKSQSRRGGRGRWLHVQQAGGDTIELPLCQCTMGQVSHVTAHAAIVATVLAAVEGFVGRMGADMLEDAAQDVVGQAYELIGPMVFGNGGGIQVVARTRFVLL
jgi:hypothetical protein